MGVRRGVVLAAVVAVVLQGGVTPGSAPQASAATRPAGAAAQPPQQRGGSGGLPAQSSRRGPAGPTHPTAARPHGAVPDQPPSVTTHRPPLPKPVTVTPATTTARPAGFDASTSREQQSRRTAESTVFTNADGTSTLRVYQSPAYVKQPDGSYQKLDLTVRRSGARFAPTTGPAVTFAATGTDPALARVDLGGGRSIGYGLAGATGVAATSAGQWVHFAGVRGGVELSLAATATGSKETLVLSSAAAPTSYDFPLALTGLTPTLDAASGEVRFTDSTGTVQAVIPPGWMEDSRIDPHSGEGARSWKVRYTLLGDATSGWVLRVELDAAWLHDPARQFPVTVDPAVQLNTDTDDTYVMKPYVNNYSGDVELKAGTFDGGSTIAASYLHFSNLLGQLKNQYILGASVNVLNIYSYSCNARPIDLYAVSQSWSGSTMTSWPGASLGAKLATANVAYGYTSCPNAGWVSFGLDPALVTSWTHGTPFYGFSLRASSTDSYGWKRFASANGPTASNIPFLDVTYSPQGASYHTDSITLPTNTQTGSAKVTVTNLGSATWPAGGSFKLHEFVKQGSTLVNATSYQASPPVDVPPGGKAQFSITLPALAPGSYTVYWDMWDPGHSYHDTYGVPYGTSNFTVVNILPYTVNEQPASGADVNSLTPTLYAEPYDPDNWPNTGLRVSFRVCDGPVMAQATCFDSGWISGRSWAVPAGKFHWGTSYYWWTQANDNIGTAGLVGPLSLNTVVPQPEITSHLATQPPSGAGNNHDALGLDPQVGNYTTAATDASVSTVGPDLTITRTYNSLDPRRDHAFGAGWMSRLDTRLVVADDGSGDVTVTLPNGQEVRFGANPDGTFAPPAGRALTLTYSTTATTYTLRDATGGQWVFDGAGRLVTIKDAYGRAETLSYDTSGQVATITNRTSGRSLTITWSGGHVTAVTTDPPSGGAAAPTWSYSYTGDLLTSVCAPDAGTACTHYSYGQGSHYRSVVTDDNPKGYWRFGEAAGAGTAASVTARTPGADSATYSTVTLGTVGALAATGDTAATFDGTSSVVTMPTKSLSTSLSQAVELWFRTTSGGVLLSMQNTPYPAQTPTHYTPLLYVGTDGKLHGNFWVPTLSVNAQIVSVPSVNDGAWHHALLTSAIDTQTLYLDGVPQGTTSGLIDHRDMDYVSVGSGRTTSWPAANGGNYYFAGDIDEVAFYGHPLGRSAAQAHVDAAHTTADELTGVTLPQGNRVYANVTYDDATDRVRTLTDHDGGQWTLDAPARNGADRTVVLHSTVSADLTFTYDADHAGRPVSRVHGSDPARTWSYNAAGFLSGTTDENGDGVSQTTDARGNVLSYTTCQTLTRCGTAYYTYYLNGADPLDPRNDKTLTVSDGRSTDAADARYRTSYSYDTAGNLTSTTSPTPAGQTSNPTVTRGYTAGTEAAVGGGTTPPGLLATVTGARGQVTSYSYTATGDLARVVAPSGLRTSYSYDALGRVTAATTADAGGTPFGTTSYTYTALSQRATVTAPAVTNPITGVTHQLVTTLSYDADGNITKTVASDATGGDTARTTSLGYDAHDRLTSTTFPDGGTESRGYDAAGNLTSRTDQAGFAWSYGYDDRHHLTQVAIPAGQPDSASGQTVQWRSYDPAGRLVAIKDALGRSTVIDTYADGTPYRYSLDTTGIAGAIPSQVVQTRAFDLAGHLTSVSGPNSVLTTTYGYDNAGNVETTTVDPTGADRATTVTRDADGNVLTSTATGAGSPGRSEVTDYSYDPAGAVKSVSVHNDGTTLLTTSYARDARGLVTSVTDPNGAVTSYGYDPTGAVTTVTGPAVDTWVGDVHSTGVHPTTTTGRDTFGEPVAVRDPDGNVTTSTVDAMGRVTQLHEPTYTPPVGTGPINPVTTLAYDHAGQLLHRTDPLGRVTSYTYDRYGHVLTRADPQVGTVIPTTTYSYDAVGNLVTTTDPTGAQTQATYDELDRRITSTQVERTPGPSPAYYVTNYGYDPAGNLATVTSPLGHATTVSYDPAGDPVSVTDATQRKWSATYDLAGRKVTATDPTGLVTATSYDLAGRAVSVSQTAAGGTSPLRTVTSGYDADGNLTQTTSGEGRTSSFGYDAAGRRISQTERVDASTTITSSFGYDAAGQATRFVDGNGHATVTSYNPLGLVESVVEPATTAQPGAADRTWTTTFDAAGQAVRVDAPGGVSRTRTFDALGRLTAEHGVGGADAPAADRGLGYDLVGRVTRVDGAGGVSNFGYDDRGDLVSVSGAAGSAQASYDADGRLVSRVDGNGTTGFGYDAAGRLSSLTDPLSGTSLSYGFDAAGRVTSLGYGSVGGAAASESITRDALGRVTAQVTSGAGMATVGVDYGYDRDDNVVSKTTSGTVASGANAYVYDGANRLVSWTPPSGSAITYGWDAAGNRIRVGSVTASFDERNRLLSDGTSTYQWTPRGTLASVVTSGVARNLTFDGLDRLVTDGAVSYGYDSLDRVLSRDGTGFSYSDLSGRAVSAAGERASFTPGGVLVSTRASGAAAGRLAVTDAHTDVVASVAADTGAVASTAFDPFGVVTASSGAVSGRGYQQGFTDPVSGAVGMGARWYEPGMGGFASRDSWTLPPTPSGNANRYAYVLGNPLTFTDPTGH